MPADKLVASCQLSQPAVEKHSVARQDGSVNGIFYRHLPENAIGSLNTRGGAPLWIRTGL